jgi:ATP-dependent protease ClpP protease subunit
MRSNNMSEETFIPMFPPKNIFTTEVRGQQHTYYLTGPITEPENYVDLCNILRSSGPQDEILIRINSSGGSVATERMICNAIEESEANVVGFIEYACMSAATTVFLACKQHGWGPHIQFMIHCAWWSSYGKTPDIKSHTEFAHKQMEEEIIATYSGLLDESELKACNDGKEFWFGAKELEQRMKNFYEYRDSQPCGCGSPDCEINARLAEEDEEEPEFSLEDIIEKAVQAGVTKALAARDAKEKKAARPKKPEGGAVLK